jgi:hypothetical protein
VNQRPPSGGLSFCIFIGAPFPQSLLRIGVQRRPR